MCGREERVPEIGAIMEAFGDYIAGHNSFDLVFSSKLGYIWFRVQDGEIEGVAPVESERELLSLLFDEIVYDAMLSGSHAHMEGYPTPREQKLAKRRIADILDREAGKEEYLRLFDLHLKRMGEDI